MHLSCDSDRFSRLQIVEQTAAADFRARAGRDVDDDSDPHVAAGADAGERRRHSAGLSAGIAVDGARRRCDRETRFADASDARQNDHRHHRRRRERRRRDHEARPAAQRSSLSNFSSKQRNKRHPLRLNPARKNKQAGATGYTRFTMIFLSEKYLATEITENTEEFTKWKRINLSP